MSQRKEVSNEVLLSSDNIRDVVEMRKAKNQNFFTLLISRGDTKLVCFKKYEAVPLSTSRNNAAHLWAQFFPVVGLRG
eukprot:CAMPEP_0116851444 /NCGR_PEP_ID=MMETSP0418-20121206/16731_1 /TAXON_ID=1158023 /ORGANISM="Astrosyne radiata, Strain 13vi08-1A" /LENGTH=77 /DNA_ID=CAMNT_0004483477 /DNA_START=1708 /DNA_END=1938 /DNA_ORIENTATION=+